MLTTNNEQVTLAVAMDASVKVLSTMLIFKGVPNECIANCKFALNPDFCHYACQKKTWRDNHKTNRWIDVILVPWKNLKVPGIIPILIDEYFIHMMCLIVN